MAIREARQGPRLPYRPPRSASEAGRPRPQHDRQVQRLLAAQHRQGDFVAGALQGDIAGQLVHAGDLPAIELRDDVAPDSEGHTLQLDRTRAAAQTGLCRRRTLLHRGDQYALVHRQLERLGDRRVEGLPRHAEEGVLDLAGLDDLVHHALGRVDRHGEPEAGEGAGGGGDLLVDADDLVAGVDQRSARVAGVDGRIGLQSVGDHGAVGRLQVAPHAGDDAGGHREVETERVADGDHRLAHHDLAGVAERERMQRRGAGVDLDHGHVTGVVEADHLAGDLLGLAAVLLEGDGDACGLLSRCWTPRGRWSGCNRPWRRRSRSPRPGRTGVRRRGRSRG